MARPELGALLLLAALGATAAAADDVLLRHRAPITVETAGALVRLPLPVEAYARSQQASLADLRVVDARGERVPFALLAPRADETVTSESWHDTALHALPPRPAAGGHWAAPVDLTVEPGGRITVRTRGGKAPGPDRSPGWLVDLGERARDTRPPSKLQLGWDGPAEFSATYTLEHSADLRQWRPGGGGQVLALAAPGGALTQPDVPLPADAGRFVRITWTTPAPHPPVVRARAATPATRSQSLDPPREILLAASAEPAGPHAGEEAGRALHYDLGAAVPVVGLQVSWASGNRVLPVRVQVRQRSDERWRDVAGTVFYRLEQPGSEARQAPALALRATARYLRLVPDARAGVVRGDEPRVVAQLQLAGLVFAAQGQAPYTLLAGSAQAPPGDLPLATVVPDLERARERFGLARLGAFSEVGEAAALARSEERRAALRPWLLWGVLVAGVAGLGLMVWRLARPARPT